MKKKNLKKSYVRKKLKSKKESFKHPSEQAKKAIQKRRYKKIQIEYNHFRSFDAKNHLKLFPDHKFVQIFSIKTEIVHETTKLNKTICSTLKIAKC